MLCQNCGERQATFHFKQIINGKKTEIYLCEQCRKELSGDELLGQSLNWNNFFNVFSGKQFMNLEQHNNRYVCEYCGMRFEDFKNGGNLGCEHCYEIFKDRMDGVLKRLHGSNRHKGRLPEALQKSEEVTQKPEEVTQKPEEVTQKPEEVTQDASTDNKDVHKLSIKELKARIKECVKNEEYEEAAILRDIVRQKEAGEENE